MSEHYCPECADGWSGAYTCELRCTTCGSALKVRDADPSRLNPEVEIKELNAVIDQLTERAEKAERERDALAAHIGRLTSDIQELMDNSDGVAGLHLNGDMAPWSDLKQGGRFESWLLSLEDAPEASLAKLIAEKQAEALEDYGNQHFGAGSNELRGIQADAKRYRRQAEAQPHSEDDV